MNEKSRMFLTLPKTNQSVTLSKIPVAVKAPQMIINPGATCQDIFVKLF